MKIIQSILFPLSPCLLLASCCEMDIDQQCYRQGDSSMVGDLGNTGYRAATTNLHKGLQRVAFPKVAKPLDVDVSEMQLIKTATGKVEASGEAAKEVVTANMTLSTTWNNSSDMVIRIFEFTNPIELVAELNRPENVDLRSHLKMRGTEARIITRVVRAYNSTETREQTNAGQITAKVVTGNPPFKFPI